MTVIEGVDFANARPSGAKLKAAGKHFVVRYLSPDTQSNPGKLITLAEVENYHGAGLAIAFVWETTTSRATDGFNEGVKDAKLAQKVLLSRGAPKSTPIYFVAQDEGGILGSSVVGYFKGIISVLGLARVGAYGGIAIIKYLFNHKLITWGWQTYAWSAGQWEPRAQLQQYHNGVTVAGVTVDLTRATVANYGQWPAPGTTPAPPIEEDELSAADVQDLKDMIAAVPGDVWHGPQLTPKLGADGKPLLDANGGHIYTESASARSDQEHQAHADIIAKLDALPAAIGSAVASAVAKAVASTLETMPAAGGVSADEVKAIVESAKVTVPLGVAL